MSILLSPTQPSAREPAVRTAAATGRFEAEAFVQSLRALAARALQRMYLPEAEAFAFTLGREGNALRLAGRSDRYTAISLIGLTALHEPLPSLPPAASICARLLDRVPGLSSLGDTALIAWAAALTGCDPSRAWTRLRELESGDAPVAVVDLAWALTAACVVGDDRLDDLRGQLARRLLAARNPASHLFRHHTSGGGLRSHVACFADQVYPIQALAAFGRVAGDSRALDAAVRCAERICALQGRDGQWWWHYDHRTGDLVEGYPVYAIHQDAMAPMALLELERAGGGRYREWIDRGLSWLHSAPELNGDSLIDRDSGMVWRKVARREPAKAARALQAAASRVSRRLRVPALDAVFPAGVVDYEDRPYHWGWFLHAWRTTEHGAR